MESNRNRGEERGRMKEGRGRAWMRVMKIVYWKATEERREERGKYYTGNSYTRKKSQQKGVKKRKKGRRGRRRVWEMDNEFKNDKQIAIEGSEEQGGKAEEVASERRRWKMMLLNRQKPDPHSDSKHFAHR